VAPDPALTLELCEGARDSDATHAGELTKLGLRRQQVARDQLALGDRLFEQIDHLLVAET
jgi:hypothetical protein